MRRQPARSPASPAPAECRSPPRQTISHDVYPASHVRSLRRRSPRCFAAPSRGVRAAACGGAVAALRPRLLHERLVDVHTEWQRLDAARTAAADAGKEELPQPQAEARAAERLGAVEASRTTTTSRRPGRRRRLDVGRERVGGVGGVGGGRRRRRRRRRATNGLRRRSSLPSTRRASGGRSSVCRVGSRPCWPRGTSCSH